jgi:predicted AlkP superfamily pyrophosphatase or phosphodiesterase
MTQLPKRRRLVPSRAWTATFCLVAVAAVFWIGPLAAPHRHLLIIVDGLRPDYVTADVMPNLVALGERGVTFQRHHSVYPTVTRVNASSISTGAYPESHGLMGNSVFFPRVNSGKFLDTASKDDLMKIVAAEGRLLTAPTLAEALQTAGRRLLVVSSGSNGSAYLSNHTIAGGAILHYQFALPEQLADELKTLGPRPPEKSRDGSLDRYAVDAFLKVGLSKVDPAVTIMWLSDLDTAAHDNGIGAAATVATLKRVDENIGRIESALKASGMLDDYNIWVSSDHGFSTYTGAPDLAAILKPYTRAMPDGSPRIVAGGGAIYVRDGDQSAVAGIVAVLQRTPRIGAIFTRAKAPGSFEGHVPGTLSFDAVRWQHDRSAQILFSPDWTDDANTAGWRGTSASNGTAGHGSASPWDIHNTLIAAGPDLKNGAFVNLPSGNVDFAPTFLSLLGIPIPATMQGRVLREGFVGEPNVPVVVRSSQFSVGTGGDEYKVTADFSAVESGGQSFRYFDKATVVRK